MKLRLSIAAAPGVSKTFEHAGPVVRIGRDADNELSLQGEYGDAVSRRHARIELTPKGATLTDAGSSNGTQLNGCLLGDAAPLNVGDRIQMGYTGATLTVLELDLAARPAVDAARRSRPVLIGALAAVALAAVVGGAVVLLRKPKTPEDRTPDQLAKAPDASLPQQPSVPSPAAPASVDSPKPPPSPPAPVDPPKPPPLPVIAPVAATPKGAPSEEVKEVGSYVALDQWVSVLLQRQGEAYPWAILRPEGRVSTACTLVSLPGYRSLIALDGGAHLTLWGNLPEFSAAPPVLESVVMLHSPTSGVDLDFTLDRGRVLIANRKASPAPIHVRLRFLRETWELELPDAKSEAVVELWNLPRGAPSGSTAPPPLACLGLFTKGRVLVKTPRPSFDLSDQSRLSWVSQQPTELYRAALPELPAWWAKPPERTAPQVQKALRSLLDWHDRLAGSNADSAPKKTLANGAASVVTTIKTQVEEVKDADNQDVGVFFLAALDETEPLLGFLKDRQNANVRGVTLFALQAWLSRGSQHAGELIRILERRGDSKDKAERIVRLLHFYPPEALGQKKTYEDLIDCLDDDNLLVRDLAFWQLDQLGVGGRLPEEARKIAYDPTWEEEKRRPAVEQWKKLLGEGKVPSSPRP
ncbi:MAG TPA: FHA domain-containing protein [Gemmataceae bacterium]|jgi:hypothetical protein